MSDLDLDHIFVVRHGEADGSDRLSPEGRSQIITISKEIDTIAKTLPNKYLMTISSPERRALESMFILQDELKNENTSHGIKCPAMYFHVCSELSPYLLKRKAIDQIIDALNAFQTGSAGIIVCHDGFAERFLQKMQIAPREEFNCGEGFYLDLKTQNYIELKLPKGDKK